MPGTLRGSFATVVFVCAAGGVLFEPAAAADEIDKVAKEVEDIRQQAESLGRRYLRRGGFKGQHYVEERLIDGENFYRMKDYQRAAIMFMDIIENYANHMAYPDALFLFADSLFLSRDYLGAREWFRRVLETRNQPGIDRHRHKAISRLIEIAIHLNNYEGIARYFNELGQVLSEEARYIKGKYLFFKGDADQSLREFRAISRDPVLALKARYFIGVILTRQRHFDEAIDVFERGAQHQVTSSAEQEIVDLMNLGAGRLYFEKDFVENASECYQRVAANSIYADTALYEAASVLIRAGDTVRAEQTLEVLTVTIPDSKFIPKAKLLRGNLLLRAGRYEEAEKVFEEMIDEFTPVMEEFDEIINEQGDMGRFFDDLVKQSLSTMDVSGGLPPLVVKWVAEEQDVQYALELAQSLGAAREYVGETERLVRLLEAVIDGPSKINAIPSLREAKRRAQQMNNRLGQLRARLIEIEQNALGDASADLKALRDRRGQLTKQMNALPTSDAEFEERDARARQKYDRMRKELSRNRIRLDQLSAMVVAIERFITDSRYIDGVAEENLEMVREELNRYRAGIERMHDDLKQLKTDVESARYQVGIGDNRDRQDEKLRAEIKTITEQEHALLRSRGGEMGRRLDQIFSSIDGTESTLQGFERSVEREATEQIDKIKRQVELERSRVVRYRRELGNLNDEAQDVVGGVTFSNFSNVKKRFRDLILKADVGIIDVAWLRKEEHRSRRDDLTKERLNTIKVLDEEFHELSESKD